MAVPRSVLARVRLARLAVPLTFVVVLGCGDGESSSPGADGSGVGAEGGSPDGGKAEGGSNPDGAAGTCVRDDPLYCPSQYPAHPVHYTCTGSFDFSPDANAYSQVIHESCQAATGDFNPPGVKTLCCTDLGSSWSF